MNPRDMPEVIDVIVKDAREWLEDCFEDLPEGLNEPDVIDAIQKHWAGGWDDFVETFVQDHTQKGIFTL